MTGRKASRQHGAPCYWCGRPMQAESFWLAPTRDHVIPKSDAGTGGANLVWSCRACNSLKGDMSIGEWASFRAEVPEYWHLAGRMGHQGKALFRTRVIAARGEAP